MTGDGKSKAWALIAAFAIVYVVWGSTYLAIRVADESLPPLLMAGIRFGVAGGLLLLLALITKAPRPSKSELGNAALAGCLMLCVGNGALCWSEQRLPSGIAAVLVASVALWIVFINWFWGTRLKPTGSQAAGLIIGLVGIAALVLPSAGAFGKSADPIGTAVLLSGAFSWALGTMAAKNLAMPRSPWFTNGVQMFSAGLLLPVAGALFGELGRAHVPTARSAFALAYLIVFGSIVAFTAYNFLTKATTAARLSTYAYVNPAVAVILGAVFLGEPITARSLIAMALILGAVMLMSLRRRPVLRFEEPARSAEEELVGIER